MVLTPDSERVLSSLLTCASEEDMREILAQMHCGNQDTEDAIPELGDLSACDKDETEDGIHGGRCFVPTELIEGVSVGQSIVGKRMRASGIKEMVLVSNASHAGREQNGGKHTSEGREVGSTENKAGCLRPGDIVGILVDNASRVDADSSMVAVELLRLYPNAGLAVVSRRGSDLNEKGDEHKDGWVEKVVVVEKDLWWRRDGDACAPDELDMANTARDQASEEEESASDDDDEDAGAGQATRQKGADSNDTGHDEGKDDDDEEVFEEDDQPRLDSAAKVKEIRGLPPRGT